MPRHKTGDGSAMGKGHADKGRKEHDSHEQSHAHVGKHESAEHGEASKPAVKPFLIVMIAVLAGFVILNQYLINSMMPVSVSAAALQASRSSGPVISGELEGQIIPKGVPAIYGAEMGISFDDISASNPRLADQTIAKLSAYDNSIALSGDKLKRYIDTVSQISCEYCCGAESIITKSGQAACGCAHSYAMRGLAKYLIENHGDEYTNDQILEELGKLKTLFFPGAMVAKAQVLKDKGIELNYINLASNKYRGIEKGSAGSSAMVGGC